MNQSSMNATILSRLKRVTSSGDFVAEIDGLRFFAIAAVFVFHLNLYLSSKVSTEVASI